MNWAGGCGKCVTRVSFGVACLGSSAKLACLWIKIVKFYKFKISPHHSRSPPKRLQKSLCSRLAIDPRLLRLQLNKFVLTALLWNWNFSERFAGSNSIDFFCWFLCALIEHEGGKNCCEANELIKVASRNMKLGRAIGRWRLQSSAQPIQNNEPKSHSSSTFQQNLERSKQKKNKTSGKRTKHKILRLCSFFRVRCQMSRNCIYTHARGTNTSASEHEASKPEILYSPIPELKAQ